MDLSSAGCKSDTVPGKESEPRKGFISIIISSISTTLIVLLYLDVFILAFFLLDARYVDTFLAILAYD